MLKLLAYRLVCSASVFVLGVSHATAQTNLVDDTTLTDASDSQLLYRAEIEDLAGFVNNILLMHPTLKAAEAGRDETVALARQAGRPIYNPELETDYEDAADKTYEIGLTQTIDWAGKRDAAFAVSSAHEAAGNANYEQTRNDIAASILQNLSDYGATQAIVQLRATDKGLMSDFARQAAMRYQAGDIMRVEYETAQLAYAESRMRLAEAEALMITLANQLIAFGAPVDPISWPSMPSSLPVKNMGADDINAIVDYLPAVRAANAEAQAAKSAVDQAKANKRPDPTIGIRAGEEDDESLVGVSFSIPLFVRNNFDDDVMAAVSARSRSEAEAENVTTLARANLTASLLQFSMMREAWDDWKSVSSVSMETQSKVLTQLWEARELNMSEFLLQYRQNLEAKNTAVELSQTLWRAWINVLQQSNQAERWLATGTVANSADDFRGFNDDK